jgi:6-phosphogluconolactonase (cycloisomerase 2 family)
MADTEGRHQRIGVSGMNQEMVETGAVFVQTNEEHNRVLAFTRKADGSIAESTAHETGGRGSMAPHLPSQGSVVLSGDRRFLLVANPGSGDVTAFRVDGARLELIGTVPSGGAVPRSIAERDGRVFVMNTGRPGIASFRMSDMGLAPTVDGEMPLAAADADPAQIGFTPDGRTLIVTQRGTDAIAAYPVRDDGTLGEPSTVMSSGPTPYGFAFTTNGTLIMTEASRAQKGAAAASSYATGEGGLAPRTRSLANGMSEICWAVVTPDDRFAYTTNFAESTVSRFGIGSDGSIRLEDAAAASVGHARPGLRDGDVTDDGRFLFAIDADGGAVIGWRIGTDGSLSRVGSWEGLPNTIAGLAAQ